MLKVAIIISALMQLICYSSKSNIDSSIQEISQDKDGNVTIFNYLEQLGDYDF